MPTLPSSPRWRGLLVPAVVLLAGFLVATHLQSKLPKPDATDSRALHVPVQDLRLGEVWNAGTLSRELHITNAASTDVTIGSFAASCSCLSVAPTPLTIRSGETATVTLTADLGRAIKQASDKPREFLLEVVPLGTDGSQLQTGWTLHGKVRSLLVLNASRVNFGSIDTYHGGPPSVTVSAASSVPLSRISAKCPPEMGSVSVTKSSSGPDTHLVSVSPSRALPPGMFRFEVSLHLATHASNEEFDIRIPVEGFIEPPARAVPASIHFGSCRLGSTVQDTVVIWSTRGDGFEITGIETDSGSVKVVPCHDDVAGGKAFKILQAIEKSGGHASDIRFHLSTRSSADIVLTVGSTYIGCRADE